MQINNKFKILFASALLGLIGLGVQSGQVVFGADKQPEPDRPPEMPTCYKPMMIPDETPEEINVIKLDELQNSLKLLEKQYADRKVNKTTYQKRKEDILKQINTIKESN